MGNPPLKAVAHLSDGKLVKGYTDALPATDMETLLKGDWLSLPAKITIHALDSDETVTISIQSLKALFFVKDFQGHKDYKEVKFFEGHPPIEGLWVRMQFRDGECTEGVVRNSLSFLINPGFLLKPPDPHSNNEIICVVKNSLTDFQVLGVRYSYSS